MGERIMESNWELGKARSNYHFDKTQPDDDAFKICGQFAGDWQDELENAYANMSVVTWPSRWKREGKTDPRGNLAQYEINDIINAGGDPEQPMYQGSTTIGPAMENMIKTLGLISPRHKLHIQHTGESVAMHFDKHYEVNDHPDEVHRFLIALTDWEPGQFIIFGNKVCEKWKAGHFLTFDWQNMPHGTANASFHKRPLLSVIGIATPKTMEILAGNADIIHAV